MRTTSAKRQRRALDNRRQRFALDPLHGNEGRGGEIAGRHETGNMSDLDSDGQDHLLHLEADDGQGWLRTADRRRTFSTAGKRGIASPAACITR